MAARTGGLQRERHIVLLAGPESKELVRAVLRRAPPAVEVHYHTGLNEVAMLLEQIGRSVGIAAGLFIRREGDDHIASRDIVFALQADQCLDQGRIAILHVDSTAAIEPTVLLREFERIR